MLKPPSWDALMQLGYFRNTKGQRDFISTLAFIASHEARRRMAVYAVQAGGTHTRQASREACRRAAVVFTAKPHVVRAAPRPMGAGWGAGHRPARPASREAFRRAAVVSRPSRMSPEYPARHRRAVRGAGVLPLPCPAYLPTQKREKMSSRSCSSTLSPVMRPSR